MYLWGEYQTSDALPSAALMHLPERGVGAKLTVTPVKRFTLSCFQSIPHRCLPRGHGFSCQELKRSCFFDGIHANNILCSVHTSVIHGLAISAGRANGKHWGRPGRLDAEHDYPTSKARIQHAHQANRAAAYPPKQAVTIAIIIIQDKRSIEPDKRCRFENANLACPAPISPSNCGYLLQCFQAKLESTSSQSIRQRVVDFANNFLL